MTMRDRIVDFAGGFGAGFSVLAAYVDFSMGSIGFGIAMLALAAFCGFRVYTYKP